jgi:hypothetical protein
MDGAVNELHELNYIHDLQSSKVKVLVKDK